MTPTTNNQQPTTKLLVLDNYDSFTYNLVHLVKEIAPDIELEVHRNDKITLEEVAKFDKIMLSPGPGIPSEAGILQDLIRKYAPIKPILGVCLGHQAIGEVFGGKLTNMDKVYHGVAMDTKITVKDILFQNTPDHFMTGRYHSWVVDSKDFPADLEITATDENGKIMALRHRKYDVRGVQFHPESILTEYGKEMMASWLLA